MKAHHKNKNKNIGLPPGSSIYTGHITDSEVIVSYVEYDQNNVVEENSIGGKLILHPSDVQKVQWYDIRGLHNEDVIKSIASRFGMHPIAVEDAVDVYQRPTFTEYDTGHFISLKALTFDKEALKIERETIGIYAGEGFVLTFQEKELDTLLNVRHRIMGSKGRIRSRKADYLTYAIVDYVVDSYFHVLDSFEEEVEALEESISNQSSDGDKARIFALKKELLKIRKAISPLREAVNLFSRSESTLIDSRTTTFIRDVYDHTIQIIDNVDSMRDILSGLQDLYISEISLKMNKIMQFLTIVTALFVPISFLTGLYGMNFEYIPELKYHNGYFILWGAMIISVIAMLFYFRRKKWL